MKRTSKILAACLCLALTGCSASVFPGHKAKTAVSMQKMKKAESNDTAVASAGSEQVSTAPENELQPPSFTLMDFKAVYDESSHKIVFNVSYKIDMKVYYLFKGRVYYLQVIPAQALTRLMKNWNTDFTAVPKVEKHKMTYTVTMAEPVKTHLIASEEKLLKAVDGKDFSLVIADQNKDPVSVFEQNNATY